MSVARDEATPGREALGKIDAALAKRPQKDDHLLTEIGKALCAWRDALIARHREAPLPPVEKERLERVNAVIATVFGVQFPSAGVPWHNLESARGWLADLLGEVEAA